MLCLSESGQNGLSNTRDLINTTYQNCTLFVENSVDITLSEKETRLKNQRKSTWDSKAKSTCSFSFDENELCGLSSKHFCEKTADFMQDVQNRSVGIDVIGNEVSAEMEYKCTGGATIGSVSLDSSVSENIIFLCFYILVLHISTLLYIDVYHCAISGATFNARHF